MEVTQLHGSSLEVTRWPDARGARSVERKKEATFGFPFFATAGDGGDPVAGVVCQRPELLSQGKGSRAGKLRAMAKGSVSPATSLAHERRFFLPSSGPYGEPAAVRRP